MTLQPVNTVLANPEVISEQTVPSKQQRRRAPKKKSPTKGTAEQMTDDSSLPGSLETTATKVVDTNKEIKKRMKRKKKSEEELYWRLDSDEVLFHPSNENNNSNKANTAPSTTLSSSHDSVDTNLATTPPPTPAAASWSLLQFTVRGNPVSLQRHRSTNNGRFSYNPSAPAQEAFRNVVQDILLTKSSTAINSDGSTANGRLLQPEDAALAITLIFRRKRPLHHFMSSKRGPDRLKNTAPSFIGHSNAAGNKHDSRDSTNDNNSCVSILPSDVDNLAKFVLDALNGFLYVDDKQIIALTAIKVWDNDDECLGSTNVCIRVLKDQYELESYMRQQQQQQQHA
jgi:hypothetical protein